MARPLKQTVDYFPHDTDASDGKTLTILQSKYGNDGYAFWFKLLQLLGKREGHYIDYNNPADWQFLLAKTHVAEDIANSILATLIDLDAIDVGLAKKKIIWCQHFVDNIADAYSRRQADLPLRPGDHAKPVKSLSLDEYLEELRPNYPHLDLDEERKKFDDYYSAEGRHLKRPKQALKGWLDRAGKFEGKGKQAKTTPSQHITTPEELERSITAPLR